jgi:hypothetical protein
LEGTGVEVIDLMPPTVKTDMTIVLSEGAISLMTTGELVKQSFASLKAGALEIRPGSPRHVLCVAACPVGAIGGDGAFNFSSCYTHNYREFMGGFAGVENIADSCDGKDYRQRVKDSESVSMWQSLGFGPNYKAAYCMAVFPAGEDVFTGKESAEATVTVHEGQLSVEDGLLNKPNLKIIADSETWLGILAGERNLLWALITRRVRLQGNPKWLLAFKRCFPS